MKTRLAPADFTVERLDNGYKWFTFSVFFPISVIYHPMRITIEPAGICGYEVAIYGLLGEKIVQGNVEPADGDAPFACFKRAMQVANVYLGCVNELLEKA